MTAPNSASRRHFLRTGAALAAAPFLLPARIRAAETKPSDRITLGFIGMGKQAHGLLGGFLTQPDTQVVAVCDVDTHRRDSGKQQAETCDSKKTGTDYKCCDHYLDLRELMTL